MKSFLESDDKLFIGRKFLNSLDAYQTPCASTELDISLYQSKGPVESFNVSEIVKKVIILPSGENYWAIPLLHL